MNNPLWRTQAEGGYGVTRSRIVEAGAYCLIAPVFAPLGVLAKAPVRRLLLALTLLGIAFPVAKELGYREDVGSLGSQGGLSISVTTLGLVGLYAPLLARARREAPPRPRRPSHPGLPLVLYTGFAVLSLFAAEDAVLGLYEIFLLFQSLALYFYIVKFIDSPEDVLFVFRILLVGLAIQGVLILGLATVPDEFDRLSSETRNIVEGESATVSRNFYLLGFLKVRVDEDSTHGRLRAGGAVGSPNDAAGYLSLALLAGLGVLMAPVQRRDKLLVVFALLLGSCGLLLTLSRGGWAALAFGLALVGFFRWRAGRFSRRTLLGTAVTVAAVSVFFAGTIQSRLESDDEGAAASRVPLMKLAALMIEDHPAFGVGANNFSLGMEPYLTRGFSGQWIYAVHNKYLLVWSETGTLALVAFLWFLIAAIRSGIRGWRYRHPLFSPLALGCTAGVAGCALHMWVDTFRGLPATHLLCLTAALLAVLERGAADGLGGTARARAGRTLAPMKLCELTHGS